MQTEVIGVTELGRMIFLIGWICFCLSVLLNAALLLLLRRKKAEESTAVTEEGIRQMVDAGGDNGSIDENEKMLINNIFDLGDLSAGDIATHRTDIVAVPLEATLEEIKAVTEAEKFSRIVVYDDNIDNIVGVYHVKDIAKYILADVARAEAGCFRLRDILMQPYFIPFSKKVDELLQEMQLQKVHMAIVIDEYGGTAGIVTMEDIMEEIFGNIFDEYDVEEEEEICMLGEGAYRIAGTADLKDVEEQLEIVLDEDADYDTLGGYLIGQLGRIPEADEKPEIILAGWRFCIEDMEEKRIETVFAARLQAEEETPVPEE